MSNHLIAALWILAAAVVWRSAAALDRHLALAQAWHGYAHVWLSRPTLATPASDSHGGGAGGAR
jgi:hypothetical protein